MPVHLFNGHGLMKSQSVNRKVYMSVNHRLSIMLYLKCNIRSSLRIYFARFRLSSHRFLKERGRWMKPKIELPNRICTLCNDKDIQDEYHIVLKCVHFHTLRIQFINKYYMIDEWVYIIILLYIIFYFILNCILYIHIHILKQYFTIF